MNPITSVSSVRSYLSNLIQGLGQNDDKPILLAATDKPKPAASAGGALITWTPTLVQNMDADDSSKWERSNWSNGDPFNCTWRPDHISFNSGIMTLTLDNKGCPGGCDRKPFASGEYRSRQETYGYGDYEARMKMAKGDGLNSSFFLYAGKFETDNHMEIDWEFLGQNCGAVDTNYWTHGVDNNKKIIDLASMGINACEEFHNYGIKWEKGSITWYVDGKPVRTATPSEAPIPSGTTKIMVNLWAGIERRDILDWLGRFNYSGPVSAQYDWIKYSTPDRAPAGTSAPKSDEPTAPAQPTQTELPAPSSPAPAPSSPAPAPSAGAILVGSVAQGASAWPGGILSVNNGDYHFKATAQKDPGFTIDLGRLDVRGKKTLTFEISGSIARLGQYARFVAQVYRPGDGDQPSCYLDPVEVAGDHRSVSVDIEGIGEIWKIQYMLVTDKGSCDVMIKDQRIE